MQILVRNQLVIDYCENGYVRMDCTVVCPDTGKTFENCDIVTVDSVPEDINSVTYKYAGGKFIADPRNTCTAYIGLAELESEGDMVLPTLFVTIPIEDYYTGNTVSFSLPEFPSPNDGYNPAYFPYNHIDLLIINNQYYEMKNSYGISTLVTREADIGMPFYPAHEELTVSFRLDVENRIVYYMNPPEYHIEYGRIHPEEWGGDDGNFITPIFLDIFNDYSYYHGCCAATVTFDISENATKEEYLAASRAMLQGAEIHGDSGNIILKGFGIKPTVPVPICIRVTY